MLSSCQRSNALCGVAPLLITVLMVLLAACGAAPTPTPVPTPTPGPTPPPTTTPTPIPPIIEKVDVGGYGLQVACRGSGSARIVFDSGLAMADSSWAGVTAGLTGRAYMCTYNRAGIGGSDKAPKSPRTSADMVEDLHTLLSKIGLKPPYVLVGHSLGGLNARMYAARYPSEVAGAVLVDSTHPDEVLACGALLPPKADNEPVAVAQMRDGCSEELARNMPYEGGVDMLASARQGKSAGKLGDIPLVVLSQNPKSRSDYPAGFPEELAAKYQQRHAELQKDLLTLSTNSTQLVASYSSHNIPKLEPEAIVNAIETVLKQVKSH